jgi:large subunit ribosomal protein L13|tara:strand:- start:7196 stop:7726 length:531 start_codon:yes stop_codon:yes gene_type:complete
MKIIDATDLKVGRLASLMAQEALKGETIRIVNADKAVVTGTRSDILTRYRFKRDVGSRYQGPFYPRTADRIVKRSIRGMLPYKKQRGRDAFQRIRTYIGVPEELAKQKTETLESANVGAIEKRLYMTVGALAKELGAKTYESAPKTKTVEAKPEVKKEAPKAEAKPEEKKEEEKKE